MKMQFQKTKNRWVNSSRRAELLLDRGIAQSYGYYAMGVRLHLTPKLRAWMIERFSAVKEVWCFRAEQCSITTGQHASQCESVIEGELKGLTFRAANMSAIQELFWREDDEALELQKMWIDGRDDWERQHEERYGPRVRRPRPSMGASEAIDLDFSIDEPVPEPVELDVPDNVYDLAHERRIRRL